MITPAVAGLLKDYYLPLSEYLNALGGRTRFAVDKSRTFEWIILKWFLSMFTDEVAKPCHDASGGYIPMNSKIANSSWGKLDHSHIELGTGPVKSKSAGIAVSSEELGTKISASLATMKNYVYFPAPQSKSPDLIIVPNSSNEPIVVGIAVKCYSATHALKNVQVEDEITKFSELMDHVTVKDLQKILIICATCPVQGASNCSKSEIDSRRGDIEVIIFNLSTVEWRERFFRTALRITESTKHILKTVERVIHERPTQPL